MATAKQNAALDKDIAEWAREVANHQMALDFAKEMLAGALVVYQEAQSGFHR